MKYSVVIPAFNEAEYIAPAVKAVLAQSVGRENFEIIVADNNSTDRTRELAHQAGADIIMEEKNKGSNFARQAGFEKAEGEIVAFLDADSLPPCDWLEKAEKILSQENAAAVSGPFDYNFRGIKKILDSLYTKCFLPRVPALLKFLFGKKAGVIIGGNFVVRRSALEKIGGLPPLAFWSDDAMTAMLLSRKVGKVIFEPTFVVKSSPRRFERSGLFKSVLRYIVSYLKAYRAAGN